MKRSPNSLGGISVKVGTSKTLPMPSTFEGRRASAVLKVLQGVVGDERRGVVVVERRARKDPQVQQVR